MGGLGGDILWQFLPVVTLTVALILGPTAIVARGYLRAASGPQMMRRWYKPATLGIACGMVISAALTPKDSTAVALLCLLLLLGSIDWQWRWLPIEWTVAVIALALLQGVQTGVIDAVLLQMALPAVTLLTVRQLLFWRSGNEPLGLGDVWLVAGLGGLLPLFDSFLMIGLAAASGLIELGVRAVFRPKRRKTFGVSYGTHLCIVFGVLYYLGRFA